MTANEIRASFLDFFAQQGHRVVPSSHGEWLSRRCPTSELWLRPDDGHISVLNHGAAALGWLREHAHRG